MPPRSGQKRTSLANEEPSTSHHASKKTRFVDPTDDPVNFAEEIDANLETPSAARRGRVKNEGYESDSSDDGEGVVESRKKGKAAAEEEEDDMFAMGDKEEKQEESGAKKKKKQEYLRLGDIEGQEFNQASDGSESEESDEPEDEDDAERRKKAGMGYELSSFNMRDEMEEGKFTEDGNYVRTFDPHGVHDKWMDGVDDKEIKQARRQKRRQEKLQKEKQEAEERELQESGGKAAMQKDLLPLLKKGETVLEALQRLGTKQKKGNKPSIKASSIDPIADKIPKAPTDIETITHLASQIMSLGEADVYSMTYEELVRGVRSSGLVDSNWEPPSADVRYEYKWNLPDGTAPTDTYGPYSEEEMKAWMAASYFGPSGEKVKVRRVPGGDWNSWDNIVA